MEYSYLQQPSFDSSCNLSGMPASESASQSFYRYEAIRMIRIIRMIVMMTIFLFQ